MNDHVGYPVLVWVAAVAAPSLIRAALRVADSAFLVSHVRPRLHGLTGGAEEEGPIEDVRCVRTSCGQASMVVHTLHVCSILFTVR